MVVDMRTRTTARDLDAQAVRALEAALADHEINATGDTITVPGGAPQPIQVVGASRVTAPVRDTLTAPISGATRVVVADAIDHSARDALDAAGVSWLDRRGHLKITLPGLIIDTSTDPDTRRDRRRELAEQPIRGRSGLTVAVDALRNATRGEPPTGPRALFRRTGLAVSSLSLAGRQLRDAGMLTEDGPLSPDLFWATAKVWRPSWDTLTALPTGKAAAGLLAGDTLAAIHYGIPLAVTKDYPWDLYVPDARTAARIAVRHQGPGAVAARIAVIPTPAALEDPTPGDPFPYVHAIVAALDLAADPSRGAEAIRDWNPEGIIRVW